MYYWSALQRTATATALILVLWLVSYWAVAT